MGTDKRSNRYRYRDCSESTVADQFLQGERGERGDTKEREDDGRMIWETE